MKFLSLASIAASANARFQQPGKVDSVAASEGVVEDINAMAFKGFSATSGEVVTVKATEHFYVSGEPVLAGDVVEITQADFKGPCAGKCRAATEEEIAAAKKGSK